MPIKSKDLIANAKQRNAATLAAAFKSGDEEQMTTALANFYTDVHDAVLAQAAEEINQRNNDAAVLAARGYRALTNAEMNYYTKLGEALRSGNAKMALDNFEVAMPETIIDGVIGTIRKNHPILDRINFRNTAYVTRWLLNAKGTQMAKWGKINSAITEELSGALKEINVTLCKMAAFMVISQDLLDLGPQWLDAYIRECLAESIAMALEVAVIDGTGKDEPIGMTRDISSTANVQNGVYPRMQAVALTSMAPKELGGLVKKLARNPADPTKARAIEAGDLIFLTNPFDYWGKIMPATCYRKGDGTWVRDVLPIPADIMQTAALEEGKALLGIPSRYFVGLGIYGKSGTIVKDDSVRFFEDEAAYKTKLQGNGQPMDEYAFLLLDISDMKTEIPVLVKNEE